MNTKTAGWLLFALWAVLLIAILLEPARSSDLLALWIAADAFGAGDTGAIYANASGLFTLHPPADWAARASAMGYEGPIFPYVYPPLWAAVIAPLTEIISFQTFANAMRALYFALMPLTGWLAWRIYSGGLPPLAFIAGGQLLLLLTLFGTVPLNEGQPQIIVTFLLVLSLERLRHGSPKMAGAALALAAAIKLYPALLVVLFLAARQYRASAAFAMLGAALAALSVALAGWPLHTAFLDNVRVISETALSIAPSFQLDRVLIPLLATEAPLLVPEFLHDGTPGVTGWIVTPKSQSWQMLSTVVLLSTLAALALWMRRAGPDRQFGAVWPAAIILLALPGPIAWVYYFCLPIVMFPALAPTLGQRGTFLATFVIFAPLSTPVLQLFADAETGVALLTGLGFPIMLIFALLFIIWGGRAQSPLHRASHPL